jgi:tetratricopeptide (TPR) repeat protein
VMRHAASKETGTVTPRCSARTSASARPRPLRGASYGATRRSLGRRRSVRALGTLTVFLLLMPAPGLAQTQNGSRQADVVTTADAGTLRIPDGVTARVAIDQALADKAWDRAASLLVAEAERRPQDADVLVLTARVFFLDRKPLNTAIALKKADAIRQLAPGERMLLAMSYIALGQGEWARPELDRLAAGDPANISYTYWLGRLDYDKSQFESALGRFRAVTAREPDHARAWDNMGLCYEALNREDEAARAYETAVAVNRKAATPSPWPPLNFAGLLRRQGALDRAEGLLRDAIQYDAALARAHYELGVVLEQKGDAAGAVQSLQQAAAADSTYADPFYALSRIYRRHGQRSDADAALATFERLKGQRSTAQP